MIISTCTPAFTLRCRASRRVLRVPEVPNAYLVCACSLDNSMLSVQNSTTSKTTSKGIEVYVIGEA